NGLLEGRLLRGPRAAADDDDEPLAGRNRLPCPEDVVGRLGLELRAVGVVVDVEGRDAARGEAAGEDPEGRHEPEDEHRPAMARAPRGDADGEGSSTAPGGAHRWVSLSADTCRPETPKR